MPIECSNRPLRRLDARARVTGGTLVVANDTDVFELSDVASLIWRASDGERTVAGIVEMITAEYEVDETQATIDVEAFLQQLEQAQLIEFI